MSEFNILFTSVGRRVSLLREFRRALQELGLQGNVIATDVKENAPAAFVADIRESIPPYQDSNYIDSIKNICQKYHIKLLIPLIDPELKLLAIHRQEFQEIGTTILVSSIETNEICFNKRRTYSFFEKNGILSPKCFHIDEVLENPNTQYPLLIKPAEGSSSVGVYKVQNAKELKFFKDYIPNPILQEFIEGQEYTLDILMDFQHCVQCVVPRLRIETRAGEISKGLTVKNHRLIAEGRKIAELLPGALGCITVQCFVTPDFEIKFTEINPRFGGGIPLSIHAGADFPRWIIEMILGKEMPIEVDGWREGVVMLRYDDAIFFNKADLP